MKHLHMGDEDLGIIHGKKVVSGSRIWLTAMLDGSWWVVIQGSDQRIRKIGLIRPPQERRAREIFASLNQQHVLEAALEGRDS